MKRLALLAVAFADQGAQSLAALSVTILVARALPSAAFGRFGIAIALVMAGTALIRALLAEPFLLALSASEPQAVLAEAPKLLRYAALAGIAGALPFLVASFMVPTEWRTSTILIVIGLPLVAYLTVIRCALIAARRSRATGALASLWLVGTAVAAGVSSLSGAGYSTILLLVFLATALPTIVGHSMLRARDHLQSDIYNVNLVRTQGVPLTAETFLGLLAVQALVPLAGLIAGLNAAAGIRGAWTLAGPITTLVAGLRVGVVADASRFRVANGDRNWRSYYRTGVGILFSISAAAALVILVSTRYLGEYLLGDSWEFTSGLVLPMLITAVVSSTHIVSTSILRARHESDTVFRVRTVLVLVILPLQVVGLRIFGAAGAAWVLAISSIIAAPIWFVLSVRNQNGKAETQEPSSVSNSTPE